MKKFNRFIIYLLGILFLSLGSVLGINSMLGVSTVSALPLNISIVTNSNMGTVSTYVFIFFVILQILILRKDFKLIQLSQVIVAVVFGQVVNFFSSIITFNIDSIVIKGLIFIVGLIFTSMGIIFTIAANIVSMPPEGLIQAINSKVNKGFGTVKMYFDCTNVTIAVIITFIFGAGIGGVGVGTIFAAILTGRIVSFINKIIGENIEALIFENEELNIEIS